MWGGFPSTAKPIRFTVNVEMRKRIVILTATAVIITVTTRRWANRFKRAVILVSPHLSFVSHLADVTPSKIVIEIFVFMEIGGPRHSACCSAITGKCRGGHPRTSTLNLPVRDMLAWPLVPRGQGDNTAVSTCFHIAPNVGCTNTCVQCVSTNSRVSKLVST